jgi:hypothetical protein
MAVWNRSRSALLVGVAILLVLVGTGVAEAENQASAPAEIQRSESSDAPQWPDEVAALSEASRVGSRVPIPDATTETSESFALPGGRIETSISAGVVRLRRDGGWVPVDLNLRENPDGTISSAVHPAQLNVSGRRPGSSGELASIETGTGRVSMGWNGALPEPVLAGPQATYSEVLPGVDLVIEATRSGFEQFVVLKSPAAVSRVRDLKIPLAGANLGKVQENADGSLNVTDKAGKRTASVPAPLMWDSQVMPNGETPANTVALDVQAATSRPAAGKTTASKNTASARAGQPDDTGPGTVSLTLSPDETWLRDPATKYPVTIDPQINRLLTTFDTTVMERVSADRGGANYLQLGVTTSDTPQKARSFVKWDSDALMGKHVESARAYFYNWYSTTCSAKPWEIWTTAPADGNTRWANQPQWIRKEATSTETKGFNTSCNDGWVSIDARSFFQYAADTNQPVADMGIRAAGETDTKQWKEFRSRNAADTNQVPYAKVTYRAEPKLGARSTVPGTVCLTGASRPAVPPAALRLQASFSSPDAATTKSTFEWSLVDNATPLGSATTAAVAVGQPSSATIPQGVLAEGKTYRWRVRASDGVATSAWSGWCEFVVRDDSIDADDDEGALGPEWISGPSAPAAVLDDVSAEPEPSGGTGNPEDGPILDPDVPETGDGDDVVEEVAVEEPALLRDPTAKFAATKSVATSQVKNTCKYDANSQTAACMGPLTPEELAESIAEGFVAQDEPVLTSQEMQSARAAASDVNARSVPLDGQPITDGSEDGPPPFSASAVHAAARSLVPSNLSWCDKQNWQLRRRDLCKVFKGTAKFWKYSTNRPPEMVGAVYFKIFSHAKLKNSATWDYTETYYPYKKKGSVSGARIHGSLYCLNACTTRITKAPFDEPVVIGKTVTMRGKISMRISKGKVIRTGAAMVTWLTKTGGYSTNAAETVTPAVRCDWNLHGQPRSVGCIVPGVVPYYPYYLDGGYPELARHIKLAQDSGLPGKYPGGRPLTRSTGNRSLNDAITCPDRLVRPDGHDCDEYPFASTYQGPYYTGVFIARSHDGCHLDDQRARGDQGFSRCMINSWQNQTGGARLGGFYTRNRVLNRDPFRIQVR